MQLIHLTILLSFLFPQKEKFKLIRNNPNKQSDCCFEKKIKPNKNIQYWEYREYDAFEDETQIIYKHGKKDRNIPCYKIKNGFYMSGHHFPAWHYIVYIDGDKIKLITTKDDFFNFIGEIDNLEEGLLCLMVIDEKDEFYIPINNSDIRKGSFRITKDEIIFNLLRDDPAILRDDVLYLQAQYRIRINRKTHKSVTKFIGDIE